MNNSTLFNENVVNEMNKILNGLQRIGIESDRIARTTQIINIHAQFKILCKSVVEAKKTLIIIEQKYSTLGYKIEFIEIDIKSIKNSIDLVESLVSEIYTFLIKHFEKIKNKQSLINDTSNKVAIQQNKLTCAIGKLKNASKKIRDVSEVIAKAFTSKHQYYKIPDDKSGFTKVKGKFVVTCKLN